MKIVLYIVLSFTIYLIVKREEKSYLITHQEKCKNCGKEIDANFLHCPFCHEEIKKICNCCGKLIDIDWRYCPFCENDEKTLELYKIIGGKK